jgi:hypothetical protein
MTKKDEVINKLIVTIGREVDYWLLEANRAARETEYGFTVYKKMVQRYERLRSELLTAVCDLAEILKQDEEDI